MKSSLTLGIILTLLVANTLAMQQSIKIEIDTAQKAVRVISDNCNNEEIENFIKNVANIFQNTDSIKEEDLINSITEQIRLFRNKLDNKNKVEIFESNNSILQYYILNPDSESFITKFVNETSEELFLKTVEMNSILSKNRLVQERLRSISSNMDPINTANQNEKKFQEPTVVFTGSDTQEGIFVSDQIDFSKHETHKMYLGTPTRGRDKLNPNPFSPDWLSSSSQLVELSDGKMLNINTLLCLTEKELEEIILSMSDADLRHIPEEILKTEFGKSCINKKLKSITAQDLAEFYQFYKEYADNGLLNEISNQIISKAGAMDVFVFASNLLNFKAYEDFLFKFPSIEEKLVKYYPLLCTIEDKLINIANNAENFESNPLLQRKFLERACKIERTRALFQDCSETIKNLNNLDICDSSISDILFIQDRLKSDRKFNSYLSYLEKDNKLLELFNTQSAQIIKKYITAKTQDITQKSISYKKIPELKEISSIIERSIKANPKFALDSTDPHIVKLNKLIKNIETVEQRLGIDLCSINQIKEKFKILPTELLGKHKKLSQIQDITEVQQFLINNLGQISKFVSDDQKTFIQKIAKTSLQLDQSGNKELAKQFAQCLDAESLKDFLYGTKKEVIDQSVNAAINYTVGKTVGKLATKYLPKVAQFGAKLGAKYASCLTPVGWAAQLGFAAYNLYQNFDSLYQAISGLSEAVKAGKAFDIGKYFVRTTKEFVTAFAGIGDLFKFAKTKRQLNQVTTSLKDGIKDAKFASSEEGKKIIQDFYEKVKKLEEEFGKEIVGEASTLLKISDSKIIENKFLIQNLEEISEFIKKINSNNLYKSFASDPAKGKKVTLSSVLEAIAGISAEEQKFLKGLRRSAREAEEFIDKFGISWDVKTPLSKSPTTGKYIFNLEEAFNSIVKEYPRGENIIINITHLEDKDISLLLTKLKKSLSLDNLKRTLIIHAKDPSKSYNLGD